MRRTPQEIVELVVFGLIALLLGTGVLWLLGAVFGILGTVLGWLAALLWGLLSFLVPVALVAGAVVLIVRWAQGRPMPGSTAPNPVAAPSATVAAADPAVVPGAGATEAVAQSEVALVEAVTDEDAAPAGEVPSEGEAAPEGDEAAPHDEAPDAAPNAAPESAEGEPDGAPSGDDERRDG